MSARSCIVENRHQSCFDILNEDEKQVLQANTAVITYKKGDIIAKQGAFASHVIYLEEGLVKVYLEGKPKDLILKIIPSDHLIGLPSIYDGNSTFLYSASTYTDSRVRMIDINTFKHFVRTNAQFASMIINILNENTAQIYGRFYCMMRKQSHGRVADILLCLSERVYKKKKFLLALSRGDLAALTGLSCESVIRIFKEFKDEGIIQVTGKSIEIMDFTSLERISSFG